ncbi:MAG: hypothetical protein R2702_11480 [Acidimicrobiales bacterium]
MTDEIGPELDRPRPSGLRDLSRRDRLVATAVAAGLIGAAIVLVWRLRTGDWTQVGDEANQINGAQLAPRYHPLLGDLNTANLYGNPISHHPGPMAWYLLAPWVILLGPQLGGWLFAATWNLGNLLASAILAKRCGGPRTALVAVLALSTGFALEMHGQFASSFFQTTPLLALGTYLLACWAIARSDPWATPVAVVTGTFILQSATIQGPLILTALVAAALAAWLVRRAPGTPGPRGWRWPLATSAVLGGLLWAPPVFDQLHRTGNLGKLARIEVEHAGISGALDIVGEAGQLLARTAPALVLLLIVTMVLSRDPDRRPRRADVLVLGAIVIGSLAIGAFLPVDDVEETHRHWVVIVLGVVFAMAWSTLVGDRRLRRPTAALALVAVVASLLTAVVQTSIPAATSVRDRSAMRTVLALEPEVGPWASDRLPIFSRGGWTAVRIAQGLAPLLHDRRPEVALAGGRPAPGTILVVATPPLSFHPGAAVEATYSPPASGRVDADLASEVAAWSTANGPLRLHPSAASLLPGIIDGRVDAACVDALVDDPAALAELGPELVLRLYAENVVERPALPPHLDAQLSLWLGEQPVTVYRMEVDETAASPTGSDDLLFTRSSC